MPDISVTAGGSLSVASMLTWRTGCRGAASASGLVKESAAQGVYSSVAAWYDMPFRGSTMRYNSRLLLSFDTSGFSDAEEAAIYIFPYIDASQSTSVDYVTKIYAIKAGTGWDGSDGDITVNDYANFDGAGSCRTASMSGHVTDYGTTKPFSNADTRYIDEGTSAQAIIIKLNSTAVSDMNSDSQLLVMLVNTFDYNYTDITSHTTTQTDDGQTYKTRAGIGHYTSNNSDATLRPFLRYTTSGDVSKINGVSQMDLNSMGPAQGGDSKSGLGVSFARKLEKIGGKAKK